MFELIIIGILEHINEKYSLVLVTDEQQPIVPLDQNYIFVFFRNSPNPDVCHITVCVYDHSEKCLMYLDPLANYQRYKLDKTYLRKISSQSDLEIKFKTNIYQKEWQTKEYPTECGLFCFIFLHNLLLQELTYNDSVCFSEEDEILLEKLDLKNYKFI